MAYCANFKALLISPQKHKVMVTRTRCKMWSCEHCAEVNRLQWRAKIIHGINKLGGLWSWFTLTAHSKKRGAARSLKNLRAAWDTLIKRMKRRWGKFAYIRVFEEHADGTYHLHAIASFNFDDIAIRTSKKGKKTPYSRKMAQWATDLKIGYYTHADNILMDDDHHAGYVAAYVTKYIMKISPRFRHDLGRVRHIQTSQKWPKRDKGNSDEWVLRTGIYKRDIEQAEKEHKYVVDIQTGDIITDNNFVETYIYPPEFDHRKKAIIDSDKKPS